MNRPAQFSRRTLLQNSAAAGTTMLLHGTVVTRNAAAEARDGASRLPSRAPMRELKGAQWVWYPSGRCLANTFVLFRRELSLKGKPRRATGWVVADSRYALFVNGRRLQFGPAPCDPRWLEADPVDLTALLTEGDNVIAAQVLYYGHGDGTSPLGKPGFLFGLEIEAADGQVQRVVSDGNWRACLPRAWRPGQYKRWYLRSLQEEFDARAYPYGWESTGFKPDDNWLPAMNLNCPPDEPAVCSHYPEYALDMQGDRGVCELRRRSVPMLREYEVPAARLAESMWLQWRRPVQEYFECLTPDAFAVERAPAATPAGDGAWRVEMDGTRGAVLTFEFAEQIVGWPHFTIEAPAGTTVELLVQEAHQVGGPALLNTHFHAWSRFTCREGVNRFEPFDFESCRWVQLHIHNAGGPVTVREVGLRRRIFPWPNEPRVHLDEAPLQRLMDASINTLHNSAQETCVDGMGRERQQYSGDGGHQLHAIYYTFGETRLPARFCDTFSQGITLDGYFLDCWPAYDRLARLIERQMQLTGWGPLLDHGVGFNFDCFYYHLYTGDTRALGEAYPRLLRFAEYLRSIRRADGLLPVENIGVPSVWIDHQAYQRTRHKQCAFNLYAAAMLTHALAPLCRAFGDTRAEEAARTFGRELLEAAVRRFWNAERGVFVNNLPWLDEEKGVRLCDRSLATAILFDQVPGGKTAPLVNALVECPPEMGFSYPANAGWRLWALGKAGRPDVIVKDLRERWAKMDSVRLNNTLQEDWTAQPDSGSQWSHCAVVPLYVLYMSLAGFRPLEPGFARCEIRPQLADLSGVDLVAHTPRGPIVLAATGRQGDRELRITPPEGCAAELVLPENETVNLKAAGAASASGTKRYVLPPGRETRLQLRHA